MKRGYFVASGYMGFISLTQEYQLFASESDYHDYVAEGE